MPIGDSVGGDGSGRDRLVWIARIEPMYTTKPVVVCSPQGLSKMLERFPAAQSGQCVAHGLHE